jgi:hypothetical protein
MWSHSLQALDIEYSPSNSDDLAKQFDRMMGWKECNHEGIDPSDVHDVWKHIINQIECGHKRVQISRGTGERVLEFKRAAEKYVH